MGKQPKATPAEKDRLAAVKRCPCLACDQRRVNTGLPRHAHHQLRAGRRIGHDATVCLCAWHHVGDCRPGYKTSQMTAEFGPSLAKGSKRFHAEFGTDAEMLERQNQMLGLARFARQVNVNAGFAPRLHVDGKPQRTTVRGRTLTWYQPRPDRKPGATARPSKMLPPLAARRTKP